MCWVMPPASPAATSVSRIASSSEVLPWSTWPMIGDDRRALDEVLASSSSYGGLLGLLVGGGDDLDLAVELAWRATRSVSSESVWVRVAISPTSISLDHLGAADAEDLGDLADGGARVDLRSPARSSAAGSLSLGSSSSGRRRRPPRRRGGRGGGWVLAMWSRRAACESITTRRRFLAGAASWRPRAGRRRLRRP